jgi:two-component system NarL family sensor kinase
MPSRSDLLAMSAIARSTILGRPKPAHENETDMEWTDQHGIGSLGARRPLGAVVAVAVLLLLTVAVTALRIIAPSDASLTVPDSLTWTSDGVQITSLDPTSSLRSGDYVEVIDGYILRDGKAPDLRIGDVAQYEVSRDSVTRAIDVNIVPFPAGAALVSAWPTLVLLAFFFLTAGYVFLRRPQDPAAQLWFVAAGCMALGSSSWILGMQPLDFGSPLRLGAYFLTVSAYVLTWATLLHFSLIFPGGRDVKAPRVTRWWPYMLCAALYAIHLVVGLADASSQIQRLDTMLTVSWLPERVIPPLIAIVLAVKYRRATEPTSRRGLQWIFLTTAVAVGLYMALEIAPMEAWGRSLLPWGIHPLLFIPVPIALAAAVLRFQAFDLQVIVRRSLLFGLLMVGIFAVFGSTVGLVISLTKNLSLVAVGLVAAVATAMLLPLLQRMQKFANRLVYGDRDDPYLMLDRLGRSVEASMAPDAVLGAIVVAVAEALKVPYVEIRLTEPGRRQMSAGVGKPGGGPLLRIPVRHQGQIVGSLIAGQRTPGEPLTARDRRALIMLADKAGAAAAVIWLNSDLRESRQQLVQTREEERQRLQRDLHDGVGPTLAAHVLQLQTVRNLLAHDPARADRLITQMSAQLQELIGEIRRLVEQLRPLALDQLGLASALEETVRTFNVDLPREQRQFNVKLEADGQLPSLPAAVEVAAYRIAVEAITNSARHAGAKDCTIRLSATDALRLVIDDDGRGIGPDARLGVGLKSMRERAAEVGGHIDITNREPHGTRINATLPL